MIRFSTAHPAAAMAFATAIALGMSFGAPMAQDRVTEKRQELEEITEALATTEATRDALETEIAALAKDRAALNRQLLDTAAAVQDRESQVSALEIRLEDLGVREQDMREALRERREILTYLIAALQRVGRNPPPALLVHPDDALDSIRSALVLGAVVPQMRGQAEALIADLRELSDIRKSINTDKSALTVEAASLLREQARLSLLMETKRQQIELEQIELARLQIRAEQMAANVESFAELIERMEAEIDRFRSVRASRAEAIAAAAEDAGDAPTADQYRSYYESLPPDEPPPENPLVAKSDPNRITPAIPFSDAKGLLPLPARGTVLARFGDENTFGEVARGLSIATREGAQIVAPSDGWVVYSGPFRSYQQLLIIDAGEGYHMVLAGMDRVNVGLGQFVLAGEPVGAMSAEPVRIAASVLTGGKSQPVLYVELRKDGAAIDPTPWWAERSLARQ